MEKKVNAWFELQKKFKEMIEERKKEIEEAKKAKEVQTEKKSEVKE